MHVTTTLQLPYQATGFCVYAEVGFACDGTEFPVYYDVELDYTTSGDLCNFTDNYNDVTVGSDYPSASWTNDGGDMGYAFVSDGNPVSVSVTSAAFSQMHSLMFIMVTH